MREGTWQKIKETCWWHSNHSPHGVGEGHWIREVDSIAFVTVKYPESLSCSSYHSYCTANKLQKSPKHHIRTIKIKEKFLAFKTLPTWKSQWLSSKARSIWKQHHLSINHWSFYQLLQTEEFYWYVRNSEETLDLLLVRFLIKRL